MQILRKIMRKSPSAQKTQTGLKSVSIAKIKKKPDNNPTVLLKSYILKGKKDTNIIFDRFSTDYVYSSGYVYTTILIRKGRTEATAGRFAKREKYCNKYDNFQ